MEILIPSILGSIAGIVAGLLPGIGVTSALLILYFWLIDLPLTWILSFYVSLLVVSQYMGSVSATLLGILGEASSLPALKEGHAMTLQGKASYALSISCIGSAIGSLLAIFLAAALLQSISGLFVLNYAQVKIVFMIALFVLVIGASKNKWWLSTLMVLLGSLLGRIGYDPTTGNTWGTLGLDFLEIGIPSMLFLICLFAIPSVLLNFHNAVPRSKDLDVPNLSLWQALKMQPWLATLRGSVIGFFSGAIPYLSFVASSKFAWAVERWLDRRNTSEGHAPSLAAAETGNNAGALTSLLPLLLFAVPITISEIVLMDIITFAHQQGIRSNWLFESNNLSLLLITFLVANLIGVIAAWPMGQFFARTISQTNRGVVIGAILIMAATTLWSGYEIGQTLFYLLVGSALFVVGWLLRHRDVVPLVLGFVMIRHLEFAVMIMYQKLL